jgi:hypothetical protein
MTQQEMIPYADDPFMAEALTYMYIAQYVRSDGPRRAGVLAGDCKRYYGQIKELLSKGEICEANWVQLGGYATIAQGTEKAQSILINKVKTNLHRLNSELRLIPQRLLQYLIQDVFLSDIPGQSEEGRRVQLRKDAGRWDNTPTFSNDRPTYFCLLANRDILSHRDLLCQLLVSMGLMVTAHPYVSTDGGRTDDEIYVPSPELQSYLHEYMLNNGLAGYWCPIDLEEMHTVFHALHRETIGLTHDRPDINFSIPVRYRESVNEFINECLAKNHITEFNEARRPHFRINDVLWYDTEKAKRYQKPLLDFLLGQKPPPTAKHRIEVIVINEIGAAIPNSQVSINTMNAITDSDGRAVFAAVSVGEQIFTVITQGYETVRETILVVKDDIKTIRLRKRTIEEKFDVRITLEDQTSRPLGGVSVIFGQLETITDSGGNSVLQVAAGRYELHLRKTGYLKVDKIIEVNEHLGLEFTMASEEINQDQLAILLGVNGSDDIFWIPAHEHNWNFAIVGAAGTGKTQTVMAVLKELARKQVPYLVFDFKGDYVPVGSTTSKFGSVLDLGQISINPLELDGTNSPRDQKYQVSDIIDLVYAVGDRQVGYIRDAIKMSYADKGIDEDDKTTWSKPVPTFADLQQNLQRQANEGRAPEKDSIKGIFARLDPIFDYRIFSARTAVPFGQLFAAQTVVDLGQLKNDSLKAVIVEFLLRKLRYYLYSLADSRQPRMFVVIDEAHRLKYEREASAGQLLKEARSKGVGLLLATQDPVDFTDVVYNNIGGILSLCLPDPTYAKKVAEHLGGKVNWQDVKNNLSSKFSAFVKFSSRPDAIALKIIPFYERKA